MWHHNLTIFDRFSLLLWIPTILTAGPQFSPQTIHFHIILVSVRPCEMVTSENGFTANLFLFFTINIMGILSVDKSNNDPGVCFFRTKTDNDVPSSFLEIIFYYTDGIGRWLEHFLYIFPVNFFDLANRACAWWTEHKRPPAYPWWFVKVLVGSVNFRV